MPTLNQPAMVGTNDPKFMIPEHTAKYVTWFVNPPAARQALICCALSGVGDKVIFEEQETTGPRREPVGNVGIRPIDKVLYRLDWRRRRAI